MAKTSALLDNFGKPFQRLNGHSRLPATIRAGYDAAGSQTEHSLYWANADALSADAANRPEVRRKLRNRSRYEFSNNGFVTGIVSAHVSHMIGVGPQLRAITNNAAFNQAVEVVWSQWAAEVRLAQKLATLARAKTVDGEGFALIVANERLRHPVKAALVLIEAEQVTSNVTALRDSNHVDGLTLDAFGDPTVYHVLPQHPGGDYGYLATDPIPVPAEFVLHWYDVQRPGQHRGIPSLTPVLNVGASSRRFREATVAAAESAALLGAALLKTQSSPEETAPLDPFDVLKLERGSMTALPAGWDALQMRPEHPGTTYDGFIRQQVTELCRPLSVPVSVALGDSSQSNFASAKLDSIQWYGKLDSERADCNAAVLDPLFRHFWAEAVNAYGWSADPSLPPAVEWLWPRYPVADVATEADAAVKRLAAGLSYPSAEFAREGRDFEDELPKLAADYGVSPDDMRQRLLEINLPGKAPAPQPVEPTFAQAAAAWLAAGGPK